MTFPRKTGRLKLEKSDKITEINRRAFCHHEFQVYCGTDRLFAPAGGVGELGKLSDNAYIESFNGSFSDECLCTHWFIFLNDAREKLKALRRDYKGFRPHWALDNMTPEEYVKNIQ